MTYYCPDHKYNPPANSGFTLCPECEELAGEINETLSEKDTTSSDRMPLSMPEQLIAMSKENDALVDENRELRAMLNLRKQLDPDAPDAIVLPEFIGGAETCITDGLTMAEHVRRIEAKSQLKQYPELPDTPEAAIWPCYIGDHDACVGKSSDGKCPCECHVLPIQL
jgi:hypothetical protein